MDRECPLGNPFAYAMVPREPRHQNWRRETRDVETPDVETRVAGIPSLQLSTLEISRLEIWSPELLRFPSRSLHFSQIAQQSVSTNVS